MKPRGECRFAPESVYLAEQVHKRFLSKFLRLRRIPSHHPEAKTIDALAMKSVDAFEASLIALLGQPNRFCFRHFTCIGSFRLAFAQRVPIHDGLPRSAPANPP
jgi:hypothetical protein